MIRLGTQTVGILSKERAFNHSHPGLVARRSDAAPRPRIWIKVKLFPDIFRKTYLKTQPEVLISETLANFREIFV